MATTATPPGYDDRLRPPPEPDLNRTLLISAPVPTEPVNPRRVAALAGLWFVVALITMGLVLYCLGPIFQQRAQRQILDGYRTRIDQASEEAFSIGGVTVPTKAPEFGDPVGIIEIGSIQVQQAVVEGVLPAQTARGPGHVPGTAGPGQPGNSVIVGRRAAFGGTFGDLSSMRVGDRILVTTTQGFVVYKVAIVGERELRRPGPSDDSSSTGSAAGQTDTSGDPASTASTDSTSADAASSDPAEGTGPVDVDALFGRSTDSRLTLVTSASGLPTNTSSATVVVAKMEGVPYARTPQNGRSDAQTGVTGDPTAWAMLGLVALAWALTATAAVMLYRHSSPLVAYVLTMAPLICFTIIGAETISQLLPAWF